MPRILVVEDDEATAFIQKATLERLGIEVIVVRQGSMALPAIKEKKPDIVVLDLVLPGRTGTEIMSDMAADPALKNISIIACSGSIDERDKMFQEFRKKYVELHKSEPVVVNKIPTTNQNQIELPHAIAAVLKKMGLPLSAALAQLLPQ